MMPQQYTVRDNESGRTVTFQWNSDQPPTEADMQEVFAAAPQAEPEKSVGGFLSNIGADVGSMADAALHPIDTAKAMFAGIGEAARGSNAVAFDHQAPPERTIAQAGDEAYARPVSTALQMSPFLPGAGRAGAGLMRAGARTGDVALRALESPLGGAVVGGATGAYAGGGYGAALGALAGAANGPKVVGDLRKLVSRPKPPTPPPGARLVRGSQPKTLEQELLTVVDELRRPKPSASLSPSHPTGGGVTLPPDVPIPTDKSFRRLAPFAKNARARYRELTAKTVLTPIEAQELAHLEQVVKQQAQSSGMSYAAGGK